MDNTKKMKIKRVKREIVIEEDDIVVIEYPFTIFVNDKEIITLLCSPNSLKELTVGFLYSEAFISSLSDIEKIIIDEQKGIGYVYINNISEFNEKLRGKRTITSGCGKGTLFYNVLDSFKSKKIEHLLAVRIDNIKKLMSQFNKKSELFLNTGGVHGCAMCTVHDIIMFEEDIGRHNALDKILGRVLLDEINTKDKIILTSGRISSEILIKMAKRQVPVIVSRSAPTSLAVEMAEKLRITLIGFVRGEKMNIYTNFLSIIF
ncbi:formate dehydrogenase accessory sulfurtransferase FdhD [Schnuerera sp. xch1]|uniref:formate dehydrogenase accessory sulfurtransferase FdhD n=1 Tax=Schnuerera sp. xch1 TaxID=2874283 RepID=UPI001CBBF9EF|nr:formate dehydrogenase accessory sulfurtransferase FdhD [Schnuerera sp. xch1]MBZ2174743.1 formate dehydrogenase accessory sulfurtransferase FdhD [Schnuerera sp. xch1]